MSTRVAVVITSFNRREKTLAVLDGVYSQNLPEGVSVHVFLLDDNSSDGTRDAVEKTFPVVRLMRGDGSRFWNGGMRLAYAEALKEDFDFYVFLNDDTDLRDDAMRRLLETFGKLSAEGESKAIVVGSLQDPHTREMSYGGVVRVSRMRPLTFTRLAPGCEAIRCDTFNANIVLIPRAVARVVGNLSDAFQHSMGDFDYGLRAGKQGCSVWIAPGYYGTCSRNAAGKEEDRNLPFRQRWKAFCGSKGLPPKHWRHFAQGHAGPFWPVYFVSPYVQFALKCLLRRHVIRLAQRSVTASQNAGGDQK